MIVYIVEDTLHFIYKKKIVSVKLDCVQKGYIVNKEKFMEEFTKIMKKEKIRTKLFGDDITIVDNGYFTKGDLFFIENIFSELGFVKVNFKDIRELLVLENAVYVEINNNYMVLYFDEVIYLDLKYFKNILGVMEYFKDYIRKNIVIFGLNKSIPDISDKDNNFYYLENYANYITQSLLKVKNCDA